MTAYQYLVQTVKETQSDVCILWPYQRDRDGYGRLSLPLSITKKKIKVAAHRLAFKVIHGHWPRPMGLHSCDTPACFNPRHIFEGDDQDNKDDQVSKGRQVKGTEQQDAKLTEEAVALARKEYAEGKVGFSVLAKKYGVSKICMRWAITGRNWKHVNFPPVAGFKSRPLSVVCGKGHLLTEGNYYPRPGGLRQCKACTAQRAQKRTRRGLQAPQVVSAAPSDVAAG